MLAVKANRVELYRIGAALSLRITMLLLFLLAGATATIAAPVYAAGLEQTVYLQLKWRHQCQFAGYYAALEQGYFAEEGLDVQLIEGGPGRAPLQSLLSGTVNYAVADSGVLLNRAKGDPVVVLTPIFQHSPQVIYTREDINDPLGLRGRNVMMQDGSLTIEVAAMLASVGLGKGSFVRQSIGSIDDLMAGKTDAFPGYSINEGYGLQQAGVAYRMFSPRDYGIDFYGDLLVTTESEIQQHGARAAAMRRAVLRGWEYAINNPQQLVVLIQQQYNSQHKSAAHLAYEAAGVKQLMAMDVVPVGFSNEQRWHQIAVVFQQLGYDMHAVAWDGFIYQPDSSVGGWLHRYWLPLLFATLLLTLVLLYLFNRQLKQGIRRRTEQLETVSTQYKVILDQMQDAYYRADLDGTLIWISLACERHLGYARDELIGRPIDLLYDKPDARELFLTALAGAQGNLLHYEVCLRHKDGSQVWAEANAQYFYDQDGAIAGVEGNVRNVSERKQSEQQSHELTAQMQRAQKMESIGVLAGGIAHDFNNLLVGVMGNAELAMLDAPEPSEMRDYLKHIFKASQRGADLVRQMLAYSGQGRFLMGDQDMNGLIADVSQLLATAIGKKITLKKALADGLPLVYGDKNQLTQLVMNLITNASEAIQENVGSIEIRTGLCRLEVDDFSGMYLADQHEPGRYVCMSVRDDGCGMDEATQARIFDPFFTTKVTGSGLGLAALLGIIRSHGGALKLDSAPGKGSCFTVYLPVLAATGTEVVSPVVAAVEHPMIRGTVLVVDDEAGVRDVARRMLEREGVTVLLAEDGEAGVALFTLHADTISAVLLDLTMPKMGGEEVFHAIRNIRSDIPVLLSSGFSESEAVERLKQFGLKGFVRKPFTRDALLQKISDLD